jgi:hypothetical protein
MHALIWTMFFVGFALHLALQIQNSVRSKSNGLDTGWSGILAWLKLSWLSVLIRLFFAAVLFPALIAGPLDKLGETLSQAGFVLPAWSLAGIGGFSADSFIYQVVGLIPGMRAEMPLLVPPSGPAPTPPPAAPGGQP